MKSVSIILAIIAFCFFAFPSNAFDIPQDGKFYIAGSEPSMNKAVVENVKKDPYTNTLKLPIVPNQPNKDDKYIIGVSYQWYKSNGDPQKVDGQWILETQGDYTQFAKTVSQKDGVITATFTPPKKGTGLYRIRVFGSGQKSGGPLWIEQSDPACRFDKTRNEKGEEVRNPAYEFLINYETQESDFVPQEYEPWR